MGRTFKDKKGYPRWGDSKKLVHRTITHPKRGNVIHHIDGNKSNFRKSNLAEMSRSEYSRLHAKKKHSWF